MFIDASGSEIFRSQQGDQHVDGHPDRRDDVEDGDQHSRQTRRNRTA
jgi:hypothetical protein